MNNKNLMKNSNNKFALVQNGQRSDRIIIFGQDGAVEMESLQEIEYLPVQTSDVDARIKKMKNRGQLQQQKKHFQYMFIFIAILLFFCIFILSGGISIGEIEVTKNSNEKSKQQVKVSAQAGQNIIQKPTVQKANKVVKKQIKDKTPVPKKIDVSTQVTQPQEQKIGQKIVATQETQENTQKESALQKEDKAQTPSASEGQFLQYISETKVQQAGNVNARYETPWKVDLSYVNKDGKSLAEALYPDPKVRSQRETFHKQRIDFANQRSGPFPGANMIKYNMRINGDLDERQKKQEEEDYLRLEKQFHYSQVKQEMPVCLIVRTYNNNAQFRVEYNLNSIFTQNYSNYMAIIANDASTDGTDLIIRKYFDFFQIPKEKYAYVSCKTRNTALENTYYAIKDICSDDSIVLVLDGDDEILGRNTFKTFNREHQRLKGGWIYTNNYYYIHQRTLAYGMSKDYSLQQKQSVAFRSIRPQYNYHFRSFPARLFKMVPQQYFKDEKGDFYKYTEDVALFLPVMELACGHVYFVNTINYVYNYNTGQNDWILYSNQQGVADVSIRAKKKLECLPEFKERPIIT